MERLGISLDQWRLLIDEIEEHGYIAILRSDRYLGPAEILSAFSTVALKDDDICMLKSREDVFFWWFAIDIYSQNDALVSEFDYGDDDRYKTISPVEWMGIKGFLDAGNLLDAISQAFEGQENAYLNFAPEKVDSASFLPLGKILGQVNNIFEQKESDGTYCVMTLAPYRNGSRFSDCSLEGMKNPPMRLPEAKKILSKVDPMRVVVVRYVDPLAFGPKAGQVVEVAIDHIEIDKKYGIFLRPREDVKPKIIEG